MRSIKRKQQPKPKRCGNRWILIGLLLIAAALFLTAANFYEDWQAKKEATAVRSQLKAQITLTEEEHASPNAAQEREIPDYQLNPEMEMPVKTIQGQDYIGVLEIPALQLELPILSQWSASNLKIAPCRYSGTAYQGHFILCAHNYRSYFGRIRGLHSKDQITITDVDGNTFSYEVAGVEILSAEAVEEMENENWDLTLFTCTLGNQNRVTVRCNKVEKP